MFLEFSIRFAASIDDNDEEQKTQTEVLRAVKLRPREVLI